MPQFRPQVNIGGEFLGKGTDRSVVGQCSIGILVGLGSGIASDVVADPNNLALIIAILATDRRMICSWHP
jgi:hypothetical protein